MIRDTKEAYGLVSMALHWACAGLLPIPSLMEFTAVAVNRLVILHKYLSWALMLLVSLHLLAALWHHFIRRDHTLVRMLRGCPRGPADTRENAARNR